MGTQRILVMGDNHGDAESLRRVVNETAGETFDFITHVGDLTDGRDTAETRRELEKIKPQLKALADRGELVYIWGNRDGWGDAIPSDFSLPGTLLEQNTTARINGERFTSNPEAVDEETILLTHGLDRRLIDHFEGRAYFSGDTHVGRYRGRMLNAGLLYRERGLSTPLYGGFFIIEVTEEPPFDVEFRNLGGLEQIICHDHIDRGVLYQPHFHNCVFCYIDGKLEMEMAIAAYHGLTRNQNQQAVTRSDLIDYALSLFDSPPADFEGQFRAYLKEFENLHPTNRPPLEKTEDGRFRWE